MLAHLDAFVDAVSYRVGFSCNGDEELAQAYLAAILRENIEARRVAPVVPGRTLPADELVLPCAPYASDELIRQSVLAALKASHAIEFEVLVDVNDVAGGGYPNGSPLPRPW